VRASRSFHRPWAHPPANEAAFDRYIATARERDRLVPLLVCRAREGDIAGVFNLGHLVRGVAQSAFLGYYAFAPLAGHGYMRQGLDLVLRQAFGRLGLHRVEANIQPGNERSIALVRGAGFRREGYSPRYLKIGGRWRDHERWAILAEDRRANARPPRAGGS
jgi:ribosomal-protein-alanine N-acetyltransferase